MRKDCFCSQLKETSRTVSRLYDIYLEKAGIQSSQFGLLCCLNAHSQTINQIADFLMLDHSTVTRNMQVIHRLDWVSMTTNPADKREKFWQLTETGLAVYKNAYPLWEQAQSQLNAALHQLNLTDLHDNLAKLADTLEQPER